MKRDVILKKLFGFNPNQTTIKTEILAGLTTFITMEYILVVNPSMFSVLEGMPSSSVFTATAIAAIIGTLVMAFYAKLPIGVAPGMGPNAFFIFTICMTLGHSWRSALTAVFLEGIIYVILTNFNLRDIILKALPINLRYALSIGVGLFIALIGLHNSGFILKDPNTVMTCASFSSPSTNLTLMGICLTGALVAAKIPGALFIGIIGTTLIGIPMGITKYNGIFSLPASIAPTFCQFDWHNIFIPDLIMIIIALLCLDIFGTIGVLVSINSKTQMIKKDGQMPKLKHAFMASAVGTVAAALCGTSSTTTYAESLSGISVGGKSGLTALVIAICFGLALFLSPLFTSIPVEATAPALLIAGMMMLAPIKNVELTNYTESIPAFLCMLMIPFTYSIVKGLAFGIFSYIIINLLTGNYKKIPIGTYILGALLVIGLIIT